MNVFRHDIWFSLLIYLVGRVTRPTRGGSPNFQSKFTPYQLSLVCPSPLFSSFSWFTFVSIPVWLQIPFVRFGFETSPFISHASFFWSSVTGFLFYVRVFFVSFFVAFLSPMLFPCWFENQEGTKRVQVKNQHLSLSCISVFLCSCMMWHISVPSLSFRLGFLEDNRSELFLA